MNVKQIHDQVKRFANNIVNSIPDDIKQSEYSTLHYYIDEYFILQVDGQNVNHLVSDYIYQNLI